MLGLFPFFVSGGVATLGANAAPVLDWDDEEDDSTPDFTVDFDEDSVVEGNIITVEIYSDAGLTTLIDSFTYELEAADIVAGEVDIAADALSNGTYYVRSKVTGSGWSNTETVTISVAGGVPTYYILGF